MRVSISHSTIIIRKGWLGRQTRYKVDAWLEWTEEEKGIVRQHYLGKHEAYTAEGMIAASTQIRILIR